MIIAVAGRLIDKPNAEARRFPLKNVALVRERILKLFECEEARVLISSAACGADLLAQDAARALEMRRYVILPFARERFLEKSVKSRPGDWEELFNLVCDEAEREGNLIVLEGFEDEEDEIRGYSAATAEILNKAESLQSSGEEVLAVLIWEGKARDAGDETAAFAEKSRALNFRVKEILTK